ncbi:2-isopropylmalate synthase [Glutinoglossum americanum]|uniref:leucine--tRNA ligase n=1 Tax=Glutinoglossum americanum TaxID=1670608 RepID=A0A9P8L0L5_9PEZI|nr:2-isopropylmalate synthase [Glutinoglossum americanum]
MQTEKRDTLIAIEKKYQAIWAKSKIFQPNAPPTSDVPMGSLSPAELRSRYPKFFGTMAYPYMNGTLHAGHTFTFSKVEFATGFARMEGKRSLFPLGFHCTGMPIKACADKLVREIEMFGLEFERCPMDGLIEEDGKGEGNSAGTAPPAQAQKRDDVTKFTAKKGKAAAKAVKAKYQFQIMLSLGIPQNEIHRFADPQYWLTFFPPLCQRDLTNFGARIDWRRSFVTTDANLYYDAFVRWQMNRLKELKKIKFGERYTIYSPKDGQPCMDHDRSEGEGVGPQEYLALKLKVKEWAPEAEKLIKGNVPDDANIYFVPATMRPETMYGQTCCFVGPKIVYGVYQVSDRDYFIITERAARNMAYQGVFAENGKFPKVMDLPGSSVIGTLVNAPLSAHKDGVRILPMETVLATKGTGVVTSVPSDSPDDYATVMDLSKKAEYYGIKKEWAGLEIIPIIKTPSYGDLAAPFIVKKLKINSPRDVKLLAEAKELVYKEGYYQGVIMVGDFKGEKVEDAKPKVRKQLIDNGEAFAYSEPEKSVISRSGDSCVVALMDQWYLDYGEDTWRKQTLGWLENGLETYTSETKHQFEGVLNWLNQWACARTYGLGSKLPWDPHFLVESLSDSTIYMAYYTIAHYLHKDIFGKEPGLAEVKPKQMTDEVWDYVFTRRELSEDVIEGSGINKEVLASMRREFEYWYPLDIRVSGKDLVPNHLTFFLYIHVALLPPENWPRSIRANGHLMLNGEKMSKHTGNFLTLDEIVKKYGADASRVALADAGDGVEDANFEESVANSTILRLYTLKDWCEEMAKDPATLRSGPKDGFWDRLFENEMAGIVHEARRNYKATMYKLALKSALYDFLGARDFYREVTTAAGIGMHRDLVLQYIELQALLLTPIAPHWAEYIWLEVLNKPSTIQNELFPEVPAPIASLSAAREYVKVISSNITSAEAAQQKKKDKGKNVAFDPRKPKRLTIFAASRYPAWQEKYIDLVREVFDATHLNVNEKELNSKVAKLGEMKKAMPFVQGLKRRLLNKEAAETVFDRKLAFDEAETLKDMVAGLKKTTGCSIVEIILVEEGGKSGISVNGEGREGRSVDGLPPSADAAVPGTPTFHFENVEV